MGTWGYKSFENDGAADWLFDLEAATQLDFLLKCLRPVISCNGKIDLDDAIECLAAAEVLAAARYEPPRDVPRIARSWIRRVGIVPEDADLRLASKVVKKICRNSELADTWRSEGKLAPWQREVEKVLLRLAGALRVRMPVRRAKSKTRRKTLGDLILAVASGRAESRRAELHKKLSKISNPDRPVEAMLEGKLSNRLSPLQWVASRGMIAEARLLIARGAKIDGTVSFLSPPIGFAMEENHAEMVTLLLKAGADRQKALFRAVRDDKLEMIKLVIAAGADVNAKAEGGWMAVQWAAMYGSLRALQLLLELGSDVNGAIDTGDTALHLAVEDGHPEVARYLVEHGAKLDALNSEKKTPLDLAEQAGASEIARFLRQHGAGTEQGKEVC